MEGKVLIAGAEPSLAAGGLERNAHESIGQDVADLFRAEGSDVQTLGWPGLDDVALGDHQFFIGLCDKGEFRQLELMRQYQQANPDGCLICLTADGDPWECSFLLNAGVTPDVVIPRPASASEVLAAAKRITACGRSNPAEHLIVCVDDDLSFLRSMEQSLSNRLAGNAPFSTVFEFISDPTEVEDVLADYAESGTPTAMIVSDHVMPDLTGVELLANTKASTPFAVRVLLTGQAGMDSVTWAVNNNTLDHYISKPIGDMDAFVRTLSHLLHEHHLADRNRQGARQTMEQYQFLKMLARFETLEETLQAVVSFVAHALQAERVSLMLCEDDRLVIRASVGLPDNVVAQTTLPVGSGVAGRVFAIRAPLHVTEPGEFQFDSPVESSCSVFSSVPILVTPMTILDRPLGIINVTDRREDKPLTRGEMMFLSHAADAAAMAISNHLERGRRATANFETVRSLAMAVEAKDKYTRGHSERVAFYAARMGSRLDIGPDEIQDLERAAIMHDIGKIGVPESIIQKPDQLTEEELQRVRSHPGDGERIVAGLTFMANCLPVVRGHHERIDGQGYPDGLAGEAICLGARIIAVADSYDAMTTPRPYRGAMSHAQAVAELQRCAGTQFDPRCVAALIATVTSAEEVARV